MNQNQILETQKDGVSEKSTPKELIELENQYMLAIEEVIKEYYDFRFNVVRNKVEYRKKGGLQFNEMRDYDLNCIFRFAKTFNSKLKKNDLESLLNSDFSSRYNPFTEYIDSLEVWDGETDYINELASTVKTTEQDYWEVIFKKWITALVGSMYDDQTVNQCAIVLYGGQSIGKTTWLNRLVPSSLAGYKHNGMVNPKHRDTQVALAEKLLINLDEMEAFRPAELSSVKTMITMPSINVRRVYGHYTEFMPRRASFCGTTNDICFLTDITGNRRFIPIEVISIDINHSVSLDSVFAQAFYLFKSGFKFHFDTADAALVNIHNERFRAMSIEEEWIRELFVPAVDRYSADFIGSATDITQYMAKQNKIRHTREMINKVGKILSKMGFEHFKKLGRKVYAINLLDKEGEVIDEASITETELVIAS